MHEPYLTAQDHAGLCCYPRHGFVRVAGDGQGWMSHQSVEMTPRMQQEKTLAMMKRMHYATGCGVDAAYNNDCQSPGRDTLGMVDGLKIRRPNLKSDAAAPCRASWSCSATAIQCAPRTAEQIGLTPSGASIG